MNSLAEAREFHDPVTASSSGASHLPSQLSIIPSSRGMLSRDSGLPLDTRHTMGTPGNVFDSVPAGEGPSSAFFKFFFFLKKKMILASSSCGLTSGITGKIMVHGKGVRREPQSSSIPTPRFKVLYNPEPIKSYSKKLFSQSYDGFPEIAAPGNASWKIPGLVGISELESRLLN